MRLFLLEAGIFLSLAKRIGKDKKKRVI